jgi:hypothetical protein
MPRQEGSRRTHTSGSRHPPLPAQRLASQLPQSVRRHAVSRLTLPVNLVQLYKMAGYQKNLVSAGPPAKDAQEPNCNNATNKADAQMLVLVLAPGGGLRVAHMFANAEDALAQRVGRNLLTKLVPGCWGYTPGNSIPAMTVSTTRCGCTTLVLQVLRCMQLQASGLTANTCASPGVREGLPWRVRCIQHHQKGARGHS